MLYAGSTNKDITCLNLPKQQKTIQSIQGVLFRRIFHAYKNMNENMMDRMR
jgi:hypothetical protein